MGESPGEIFEVSLLRLATTPVAQVEVRRPAASGRRGPAPGIWFAGLGAERSEGHPGPPPPRAATLLGLASASTGAVPMEQATIPSS